MRLTPLDILNQCLHSPDNLSPRYPRGQYRPSKPATPEATLCFFDCTASTIDRNSRTSHARPQPIPQPAGRYLDNDAGRSSAAAITARRGQRPGQRLIDIALKVRHLDDTDSTPMEHRPTIDTSSRGVHFGYCVSTGLFIVRHSR